MIFVLITRQRHRLVCVNFLCIACGQNEMGATGHPGGARKRHLMYWIVTKFYQTRSDDQQYL